MGVDLGDLAVKHAIPLDSLSGKIVAMDSYNVLYQFLASIRQEDGTPLTDYKGNVTAHLSGLFYRTVKLLENGVRPVYVFDGPPHRLKGRTQRERSEVKRKAEELWKEALAGERFEDARKYAQATSRLTPGMVAEAKSLLSAMGIPHVQARSDAEAQAAMMVQKGLAYATASQDYDAILFGSPILVRNLSITGRRKVPRQDRYIVVEPEEIRLEETLASLGLTRDKLVFIGLLIGTDFNQGVKRVGPKTALKIVKETKSLDELISYVKLKYDYQFEVDAEEVMEIFLNPAYAEPQKLIWKDPDAAAITRLLVDDHDFSAERVGSSLENLKRIMKEKGAQSKLEQWF